jgi:beta-glucanase (GH16 family)
MLVSAAGCAGSDSSSTEWGPTEAGAPPTGSPDAGGGSGPDTGMAPGPALDSATARDTSGTETSSGAEASAFEAGPDDAALPGWKLTWSDEFNLPDGSEVDPAKWTYDTGPVYNNELETYTGGTANGVIQGGALVITAKSENGQYTSARLNSAGKFSQQYGRFEARIQLTTGQGMWPAFWMLGDNGGWPACGEIDIMENIGDPTVVYGSLHATNYDQSNGSPAGSANYATSYHVYAVEWASGSINFSVDGNVYASDTPDPSLFNQSSYIILNVAVGGNWPGNPDSTTMFPQTMKVDWVRVYSKGP